MRRVEVELPDRDDREARAERPPVGAAVVAHERADVGADVQRVREGRVEDDRVDRAVRQVARDVRPLLAAVLRAEDVAGMGLGRGVEAVEGRVRDPVVAPVDGDLRHRPVWQILVLVGLDPGWVVADLGVRADPEAAVERTRVHGLAAADADRGDRAVPRAVWCCALTAGGQVAADCLPLHVAGRPRLRVVGAVQPVGAEEELVRVVLVQHEGDVEVRPVGRSSPLRMDWFVKKLPPSV